MDPGSTPSPNAFDPNQFKPINPRVKKSHWAVMLFVLLALIVVVGWLAVRRTKQALSWFHNKQQEVTVGNYGGKRFDTTYKQPFDPSVEAAELTLNGGTSIYKISDTTNQLFRADAMLYHSRYALSGEKDGAAYTLNFSMKSKSRAQLGKQSDSVNFKLNLAPVWDITVNSGAAKLDFDLSKYKLRNFNIRGSAGEFSVKLGQPLTQTNVGITVGAADISIIIPKDAACRIIEHASLSSSDFKGFDKKDDGTYETNGFASAKNKIIINFSGGVSDFKVRKY
jgi:hypothetical protein